MGDRDPGIVVEDIQAAELRDCILHHATHLIGVGDLALRYAALPPLPWIASTVSCAAFSSSSTSITDAPSATSRSAVALRSLTGTRNHCHLSGNFHLLASCDAGAQYQYSPTLCKYRN